MGIAAFLGASTLYSQNVVEMQIPFRKPRPQHRHRVFEFGVDLFVTPLTLILVIAPKFLSARSFRAR